MSKILTKLSAVAARPYEAAREWKTEHSGKVIGAFPMHVPCEIAHAAGALPVILQESREPITMANAYIYPFYCGIVRSVADDAARGKLSFLDAAIFGITCTQEFGAAEILRVVAPETPLAVFQLPIALRESWALSEATTMLAKFADIAGGVTGQAVDKGSLANSIRLFNRHRTLMRTIYDLRRGNPGILAAKEMMDIVKSGMVMPRERHLSMLEQLLPELRERKRPSADEVPIFVSGHLCEAPPTEILDLIEEVGGVVVDDDLYHGFRHIATDVRENGNPIEALAEWYLEKNLVVPCPTKVDPEADWHEYLTRAVRLSRAAGVIVLAPKYCDPLFFYYPDVKETLEAQAIPHLLIETEHEAMSIEGMRTRLETFVDTVRHRQQLRLGT